VHFDGDLRRTLIDAAAERVDEVGADAISLRDVAARCGVSHAAPAHHFGDKTGLLTAVAAESFEQFALHLGTVLGDPTLRPLEQLATLGRAYAAFAEQWPGRFDLMFRPALVRTDDAAYAAASTFAFEALVGLVERCQQDGWHPDDDPRLLAAGAWGLAHGVTQLRATGALARHHAGVDLDDVVAIGRAIIGA
jgi:AcrR family transcriptional regulator